MTKNSIAMRWLTDEMLEENIGSKVRITYEKEKEYNRKIGISNSKEGCGFLRKNSIPEGGFYVELYNLYHEPWVNENSKDIKDIIIKEDIGSIEFLSS